MLLTYFFICALLVPFAALAIVYAFILTSMLIGILVMTPVGWIRSRRIMAAYRRRCALDALRSHYGTGSSS